MKTMKIFSLKNSNLYDMSYGTAQMQLHTCAHVLVCLHMCVKMLPITCDGVLVSLTYCTHVLHKGLHTCMCYSSGYKLATRVYMCYSGVCVMHPSL